MANKKKKPVYKPYLKGTAFGNIVIKRAMKLLVYQVVFIILYLMMSVPLSASSAVLRIPAALAILLICGALVYVEGQRTGVGDAGTGEICYNRQESGKKVDPQDLEKCFNPKKAVFTALIAAAIPFVICFIYALIAEKETYSLQGLPAWASSATGYPDQAGLVYYNLSVPFTAQDLFRVMARTLIFPYVSMVSVTDYTMRLVLDRLSPLLVLLPFLCYIPGYLTGLKHRADIHGNIARSEKRARKQRKTAEQQREERRKKMELI